MINLHADDYGYDPAVDEQMLRLIRGKKLAGISVLSTLASKTSLKKLANMVSGRRSPRISLHLNLTEKNRRGDKRKGSSTVRLLHFMVRICTGRLKKTAIEKEIARQLKILTNAGIRVSAIDSHQHIHALSPVAEAVVSVARKHKIKYIRSYRDAQRYTLIAQMKYRILQVASFISYVIYHGRIGLPITWKISGDLIAVMSWEGKGWNILTSLNPSSFRQATAGARPESIRSTSSRSWTGQDDDMTFITHPFLPFDTNTGYLKFLRKGGDTS